MEELRVDELRIGWWVNGKLIHTPFAYTAGEYWFSHFCTQFPDMAIRIREYSEARGWRGESVLAAWYPVIINWLFKRAERYE